MSNEPVQQPAGRSVIQNPEQESPPRRIAVSVLTQHIALEAKDRGPLFAFQALRHRAACGASEGCNNLGGAPGARAPSAARLLRYHHGSCHGHSSSRRRAAAHADRRGDGLREAPRSHTRGYSPLPRTASAGTGGRACGQMVLPPFCSGNAVNPARPRWLSARAAALQVGVGSAATSSSETFQLCRGIRGNERTRWPYAAGMSDREAL